MQHKHQKEMTRNGLEIIRYESNRPLKIREQIQIYILMEWLRNF
jgi:hypothetical protein